MLVGYTLDYELVVDSLWSQSRRRSPLPMRLYAGDGSFHDPALEQKARIRFLALKPRDIREYCFERVELMSPLYDFIRGDRYVVALTKRRIAVILAIN
jgi:hypothetical protein